MAKICISKPSLKVTSNKTKLSLKWNMNIDGYDVEVAFESTKSKYKVVERISKSTCTYIDSALKNGKKVYSIYSTTRNKALMNSMSLTKVSYKKYNKKKSEADVSISWKKSSGLANVEVYCRAEK